MSRNAQLPAPVRRLILSLLHLWLCLNLVSQVRAQTPTLAADSNKNQARAQVFLVEDPDATYDLQPVPEKIQSMVDLALTKLTGKNTVSNAWLNLVSTNDTVGIKVYSEPGPNSGTRPAVVAAVIQGLLSAGVSPRQIIIWDKRSVDLRLAGFYDFEQRYGVRVLSSLDAGYDEKSFYEAALLGPLSYGDLEFNQTGPGIGRKSYVSKLVTQKMTRIINITPLLHHNLAGVSGNLYSLAMGSVDNILRFEKNEYELSRAVPEIYALPVLGDRVVLNIVDALICQYEGQRQGLLHYSNVLDQLRFSRDPVALDLLSLQEIQRQRELAGIPVLKTNLAVLRNASLLEIGISDPKRIDLVKLP